MPEEINGFHAGDVQAVANGQSYRLRLTLGALAEISERLNAGGPIDLARKVRSAQDEDVMIIVKACLRPLHGQTNLPQQQARQIFTKLAPLFERAFNTDQPS